MLQLVDYNIRYLDTVRSPCDSCPDNSNHASFFFFCFFVFQFSGVLLSEPVIGYLCCCSGATPTHSQTRAWLLRHEHHLLYLLLQLAHRLVGLLITKYYCYCYCKYYCYSFLFFHHLPPVHLLFLLHFLFSLIFILCHYVKKIIITVLASRFCDFFLTLFFTLTLGSQ